MSVRSTTAPSSVFGRQNMQYVGRLFRNQAPFLGLAQQHISQFSMLLIYYYKIVWLKWLGNAVHNSSAVTFLCKYANFVCGNI